MGTNRISKIGFINRLQEKRIVLFTPHEVVKLFKISNENTLKHLLLRLCHDNVIERLCRGKYLFLYAKREPADFEIANFLVQPSYISLETALSFYGILEQFPYTITSLTTEKTREVTFREKVFSYSKIKKEYFNSFRKQDEFLIAVKEKAVFDFAYFVYNGLRSKEALADILANADNRVFKKYMRSKAQGKFLQFINQYA